MHIFARHFTTNVLIFVTNYWSYVSNRCIIQIEFNASLKVIVEKNINVTQNFLIYHLLQHMSTIRTKIEYNFDVMLIIEIKSQKSIITSTILSNQTNVCTIIFQFIDENFKKSNKKTKKSTFISSYKKNHRSFEKRWNFVWKILVQKRKIRIFIQNEKKVSNENQKEKIEKSWFQTNRTYEKNKKN